MQLPEFAKFCIRKLNEKGWTGDIRPMQLLCMAEECGEFVGAARRYLGLARRSGPLSDVAEELSDVVIVAYVNAELLGIDLDAEIQKKQAKITARPWREACPRDTEGDGNCGQRGCPQCANLRNNP